MESDTEDASFHEQNAGYLVQKTTPAQQPGQKPSSASQSSDPTYHDNGDPGGGAVLFGECIIKVLF